MSYLQTGASRVSSTYLHANLQSLLEETREAFEMTIQSGGSHNADFADFASQILPTLRKMLGNPSLSAEELSHLLRRKCKTYQAKNGWSSLMARKLAATANTNLVATS